MERNSCVFCYLGVTVYAHRQVTLVCHFFCFCFCFLIHVYMCFEDHLSESLRFGIPQDHALSLRQLLLWGSVVVFLCAMHSCLHMSSAVTQLRH